MSKEKYIEYTNNTFDGKAKEIILNQIELFYDENKIINKTATTIFFEIKYAEIFLMENEARKIITRNKTGFIKI